MIATTTSIMLNAPDFGRLSDQEKPHLNARLSAMQRIDGATNKASAIKAETCRPLAGRTYSEGALRKMYYEKWVAGGRVWTSLINRARVPEKSAALPQVTIRKWHELVYQFRGKHRAAHRQLERLWAAKTPIAGFEDSPWSPELPRGLSYENLMRKKYRPTSFANKVASVGLSLANIADAPGVLSTRVGLPFGSRYVFDDFWHDIKVNVPGQMGARRLLQFHCIELLSTFQCRGMKPEMLNDTTGRFERLKEREMLFLLAHVLGNYGYNPDGCELMMEHGTANVNSRVTELLHQASDGKLTIGRGSLPTGSPLAKGLYGGQPKGNFKFKAALESLGNYVHNETADRLALPAQTGSNSRLNVPDELHGQEKHHNALVVAMHALPMALRDLVRLPATPLFQALEFCDMVQERMNDRTDHNLEGWSRCGFEIGEYRTHVSNPWAPLTQLQEFPDAARAALEQMVTTDPRLSRARQLSPREVFEGLRPQLVRLRAHHVPAILGMEHAVEHRIAKDGRFAFEDQDLGPGDHVYEGVAKDDTGRALRLPAGEKYATFASTLDRQRLHVCNARGQYVGWCERTFIPTRADAAGFARACGKKLAAHQELLAPVLAAAKPILARQQADNQINATIFAEAEGSPAAIPDHPTRKQDRDNSRRSQQLAEIAERQRTQI